MVPETEEYKVNSAKAISRFSGHSSAATAPLSDDDHSVGSQKQQISELKALLAEKDNRLVALERQLAEQGAHIEHTKRQQQQQQPVLDPKRETLADADDDDSQVRDQIAAVKASLQQGCQQAQANQKSLSEEMETCRRLQQKLASRKGMTGRSTSGSPVRKISPKRPTLTQQLTSLITSVQEREQSIADIAHSFSAKGTIPVSLYQAEIQQWKQALDQLSQDTQNADTVQQSNQLLQQAHDNMQQLEVAVTNAQQESVDAQAKVNALWQMVQKYEQDKQEEIHLLDIVMEHLRAVEEEQVKARKMVDC